MKTKQQSQEGERGQAMVEFAIVFPIQLFLTLAMMQLAHFMIAKLVVNHAAYASARAALVIREGVDSDGNDWQVRASDAVNRAAITICSPITGASPPPADLPAQDPDALSALAWINDGIAQTQYHMARYAVEVIVRGVDLEFAKPTSPYATNSYKLTREPDPNVNASNAQTAYDNAYQRAQQNIPDGKRLIKQLNDLQEKILEDTAAKIRDAGVDKDLGAAFSMTVGQSGQRGADRAAIFPDIDELDPNLYVEREINMTRFGIAHGVVPSMHPNDQGLPRWTDWFDSGLRGAPFHSSGAANYRYWDSDRSFSVPNGRGGRTFVGVIRTFARHGRIYTPYA
ncbi:MAG: pilus assembly protein, partial [Planctomycetota bacterium]|nr:pilus assembly protein [Planctomycetota bacterium]